MQRGSGFLAVILALRRQYDIAQIIDVSFKYPGREDFGLSDLSIGIDMGSRVAIVGPNGAGKTTLMNLLAGGSCLAHVRTNDCCGLWIVPVLPGYASAFGCCIGLLMRIHLMHCSNVNDCESAKRSSCMLPGDLVPTSGEQRKSHKLRIGRYAQHFVDALQMDETPVDYLMNRFPTAGLKPEDMRGKLGRFGLKGHHHLQIRPPVH